MLDLILPFLRHLLQLAAGLLIGAGLITPDLGPEIIGAGLSLATLIWWFAETRKRPDFTMVRPVLRHLLQLGAGLLAGAGIVPPEIGGTIVSMLISAGAIGWYEWDKRK